MSYLYHYTSLDTLALILKNRTLCFNNLRNVDDMEEAQSEDMGEFGKFVYVSCWTKDNEESIPLWNLYTVDMHGVRIKLPENPFKMHHYKKGEFFLEQDIDTYIDFTDVFTENKYSITSDNPALVEVVYDNEKARLCPKVRIESYPGAVKDFLEAKSLDEIKSKSIGVTYSLKKLGYYKRKNWSFQKEWRYIISIAPMGLKESNPPTFEKQQEYIRRIEDKTAEPPVQRLYLKLDENALKELEVVFGPKMIDAEKIMAVTLLEKYAPECKYKDSCLKIRQSNKIIHPLQLTQTVTLILRDSV